MSIGEKDIIKYKDRIIQTILKFVPNAKIYLFGSRAKGMHHSTSDIDIAVDNQVALEKSIIPQVKEAIDDLNIPFTVDVVDFCSINENLKKQIERDKIIWK